MKAQPNEELAAAVYRELRESGVPHQRLSQKKMLARFAADMRLCNTFCDAGGAQRPDRFKNVLLRTIEWFSYLAGSSSATASMLHAVQPHPGTSQ
jgi:hypothetical protein